MSDPARKAGRDPASIQILAFGSPGQFKDRQDAKDLELAGANRMTILLETTEGPQAIREMEEVARRFLGEKSIETAGLSK